MNSFPDGAWRLFYKEKASNLGVLLRNGHFASLRPQNRLCAVQPGESDRRGVRALDARWVHRSQAGASSGGVWAVCPSATFPLLSVSLHDFHDNRLLGGMLHPCPIRAAAAAFRASRFRNAGLPVWNPGPGLPGSALE
jgi:hypothetical protein